MGAAATTSNYTESVSLTKIISICTAEFHVIHLALNSAKPNTRRKFAIFSDSWICVQAYETINNKTKSARIETYYNRLAEFKKNRGALQDTWLRSFITKRYCSKKKPKKHQYGKNKCFYDPQQDIDPRISKAIEEKKKM